MNDSETAIFANDSVSIFAYAKGMTTSGNIALEPCIKKRPVRFFKFDLIRDINLMVTGDLPRRFLAASYCLFVEHSAAIYNRILVRKLLKFLMEGAMIHQDDMNVCCNDSILEIG